MNEYKRPQVFNAGSQEERVSDITEFEEQEEPIACRQTVIHEEAIARVLSRMPDEELLYDTADLFKTLGDSTRIRIVAALLTEELCVCDIAAVLDMSVSAVSHQLRVLKQAQIVRPRRAGKTIYYSLDDDHVQTLFDTGLLHTKESKK